MVSSRSSYRQAFWPITALFVFVFVLPACQSQQAVVVAGVSEGATAVPLPPPATSTLVPVVPKLVAPTIQPIMLGSPTPMPTGLPSFTLPDPAQLTTTAQPTAVPSSTVVPSTPTAIHTPIPTFTPPALPQTLPDEHYWLKRPVAEGGVVWTNKHYPYGSTRNGELRPHHGVEFDVPYHTEILAAASGTVIVAGPDDETVYGEHLNFYGNVVIIQHDTSYKGQLVFTLYGHLSRPLVTVGQRVDAAQAIALSGATGVADGPHMHFEVRLGQNSYDATYNPLLWLWPFPDRGTVAGRVVFPNGTPAYEAPVRVERVDANSRYAATTTYAQGRLNADDIWQENFVIDDVEAGFYEVIVTVGEDKFKQEVWVYPRRTSFVEIVITP